MPSGEDQGGGGNPFDWEAFAGRFFPENLWKEASRRMPGALPHIDEYVQKIIEDSMNKATAHTAGQEGRPSAGVSGRQPNVFETHDSVIVRFRLPAEAEPGWIRVFTGVRELVIRGIPDEEEQHLLLPCTVKLDGGRAIYKNGVFEVRLLKDRNTTLKELPIRFK